MLAGGSRYAGVMGYLDGGGLTTVERGRREKVRLGAAGGDLLSSTLRVRVALGRFSAPGQTASRAEEEAELQ